MRKPKIYIYLFLILIFFACITGCKNNNKNNGISSLYLQLNKDEVRQAVDSGKVMEEFAIYNYYFEGKVIGITSDFIDFQNGDLAFRTHLLETSKIKNIEVNKSYKFEGRVKSYVYETLFMNINIIEEIDEIEVYTYTSITSKGDLLNHRSARFNIKEIEINDILKYYIEDEDENKILTHVILCFKFGDDIIAIKQIASEYDSSLKKGDIINLEFNNYIDNNYESLSGIDYYISDFQGLKINKIS